MEILFAIITVIAVIGFAYRTHSQYSRNFYAACLTVIALFYVFFALFADQTKAFLWETLFAFCFILIALLGKRISGYLVAMGIITHGVFDIFHDQIIVNSGMPQWWPLYCGIVDIALGIWILILSHFANKQQMQTRAS
ncbi:MAG: hypothetical protein OEZ58_03535 [Gammaproteobacteria bacterium]|nr:hypothetical protein [Gammaproteobacteria bacterium]MDH5728035.1 hypothetical protein [Gammaproteobacteria bacterium]